jgi:hypothetical protein
MNCAKEIQHCYRQEPEYAPVRDFFQLVRDNPDRFPLSPPKDDSSGVTREADDDDGEMQQSDDDKKKVAAPAAPGDDDKQKSAVPSTVVRARLCRAADMAKERLALLLASAHRWTDLEAVLRVEIDIPNPSTPTHSNFTDGQLYNY